jgi:hypothetical protein
MLAELAFVLVHASVTVWPSMVVVGDAVRVTVGVGCVPPPPFPLPPPHAVIRKRLMRAMLNDRTVLG